VLAESGGQVLSAPNDWYLTLPGGIRQCHCSATDCHCPGQMHAVCHPLLHSPAAGNATTRCVKQLMCCCVDVCAA
jgi:hypothetical protein